MVVNLDSSRINEIAKRLARDLDTYRPLTFLRGVPTSTASTSIAATYTTPAYVEAEKEVKIPVDTTLIEWLDNY